MKKIENIDIYSIANGLVKHHGVAATIHAATLVDERLDDGDLDGKAKSKRVLAAVEELQPKERPPAAQVH
jgi:hypothetical protein